MRIVDLSCDCGGRFAAKLLAMSGLTVECYESSGSPLDLYLDRHKKPVDPLVAPDTLVQGADLVFTSFDRGARVGSAAALTPSDDFIEISTSTFGMTGPYSGWRGGELAAWAVGGYMSITGEPDREPLMGPASLCFYVAGYNAAIAAEAALRLRERAGIVARIDISAMESMLAAHQSTFSRVAAGFGRRRTGRFTEVFPLVVLPCREGHVSLGVVTQPEFDKMACALDLPDLCADPRFQGIAARERNRDALDAILVAALRSHDAEEIAGRLQSAGVAAAAVVDIPDVLRNPQLISRDFWEQAETGPILPGNPLPAARIFAKQPAAPVCGPKAGAPCTDGIALPLAGVVVIDFTAFWAGPSATRNLADMGATVVKVERPGSRVDADPSADDAAQTLEYLYNRKMNRGKLSVVLDLSTDAGRAEARALIASADVVVENSRSGVADALGVGAKAMCAHFPRLVYVSLAGFGSTGPWSSWRSYGPTIEAASSIQARTGYADGAPLRLGHTLPDAVGGLVGTLAVLRGLRERELRGVGGWFDLAQLEAYVAMSGEEIAANSLSGASYERSGNLARDGAVQGVFRCTGEDQWIAVRLENADDRLRFATLAEIVAEDPGPDQYFVSLARYAASRDRDDLVDQFQAAGLAAAPVLNADELPSNPQLRARDFLIDVQLGTRSAALPGSPIRALPPFAVAGRRAPLFGEHNCLLSHLAGAGSNRLRDAILDL